MSREVIAMNEMAYMLSRFIQLVATIGIVEMTVGAIGEIIPEMGKSLSYWITPRSFIKQQAGEKKEKQSIEIPGTPLPSPQPITPTPFIPRETKPRPSPQPVKKPVEKPVCGRDCVFGITETRVWYDKGMGSLVASVKGWVKSNDYNTCCHIRVYADALSCEKWSGSPCTGLIAEAFTCYNERQEFSDWGTIMGTSGHGSDVIRWRVELECMRGGEVVRKTYVIKTEKVSW